MVVPYPTEATVARCAVADPAGVAHPAVPAPGCAAQAWRTRQLAGRVQSFPYPLRS